MNLQKAAGKAQESLIPAGEAESNAKMVETGKMPHSGERLGSASSRKDAMSFRNARNLTHTLTKNLGTTENKNWTNFAQFSCARHRSRRLRRRVLLRFSWRQRFSFY